MLEILDQLPAGFLDTDARQLHQVLSGPTLIHLPGRRPEPLFVSTLLHGNETTGLSAIQTLLRNNADRELPRALSMFIGNVEAARYDRRRLQEQPDYNRIWTGNNGPEFEMAQQIVDAMRTKNVFASVDVHNNTGLNPHYSIVTHLEHRHLQLAAMFGRTVVYSTRPDTTNTFAMSELCPAVTLECGLPGQERGISHVLDYLDGCLHLAQVPETPVHAHDLDLFHSVAIVTVPDQFSFEYGPGDADIQLMAEPDQHNFRMLEAGSVFAHVRSDTDAHLHAWDEDGNDAAERFFSREADRIYTRLPVMPSMLTMDKAIVRMDCLCYLMEPLDWQALLAQGGDQQLA